MHVPSGQHKITYYSHCKFSGNQPKVPLFCRVNKLAPRSEHIYKLEKPHSPSSTPPLPPLPPAPPTMPLSIPSSTVLRIKDLLCYAPPDISPLTPITPYSIQPDTPHPLILYFSCERFHTFWEQERRAYDWEFKPAMYSRFYQEKEKELESPLPDRSRDAHDNCPGRRPLYDWSVKFVCRRWRKPAKMTRGCKSVGAHCSAHVKIRKLIKKDSIQVEYYWRHGHDTSLQERAMLPCGRSGREWVKGQVREGHDWPAIKKRLRLDEEQLQDVRILCANQELS